MLAAYLFFAFGDLNIEVMHWGAHTIQKAIASENSHMHHHAMHSHHHGHGHSHHHQHDFLGFLKKLLEKPDSEGVPIEVIDYDKHKFLIEIIHFESEVPSEGNVQYQFSYRNSLTAAHLNTYFVPPES